MPKVKTFFHILLNSFIPNNQYYKKIPHTGLSFSLRYFLVFIFLANLIYTGFLVNRYKSWKLNNYFEGFIQGLEKYPDNLNIYLKQGVLKTNYNRPYFMWVKQGDKKILPLVIDESADSERINQYFSSLLITGRKLIVRKHQGNADYLVLPLEYFGNQNINKSKIAQFRNKIAALASFIGRWHFIGVIIFYIYINISLLIKLFIYSFIASLLIYLIFLLIMRKKHRFKYVWQISLHSSTLPIVIYYLLFSCCKSTGYLSPAFFFVECLFLFVAVYEAFYKARKYS